ncbi:hypothetical protein OO012_06005 [Rhodobacteraceae bacterium KMM 6894]|nr:hypothetical protein [Rhodobacteraceae bacterium KMM 6894]
MDITLHLGAHRCASTSFQFYLRQNANRLYQQGITVWGPSHTRKGLFSGVFPQPGHIPAAQQFARARGRVALALNKVLQDRVQQHGTPRLIITDENMIGTPRTNLRDMRLYPGIGERMARYGAVLGGRVTRVALSIRAQDAYWASCLAFSVARGASIPTPLALEHMAISPRSWRDVITDLACAMPGAEILVMPHEIYGAMPERKLAVMLSTGDVPRGHAREWLNRGPDLPELRRAVMRQGASPAALPPRDGPWRPFAPSQMAAMAETYADDLFWLRAGAEGLATLTEETDLACVGQTSRGPIQTRGRHDGKEDTRRLA